MEIFFETLQTGATVRDERGYLLFSLTLLVQIVGREDLKRGSVITPSKSQDVQ